MISASCRPSSLCATVGASAPRRTPAQRHSQRTYFSRPSSTCSRRRLATPPTMNAALAGLTGTASLAQELDKKMLVCLRDGRKIIGILRSFDQFANIVLEQAQERVIVGKRFADVPLGLYVIRGENVVLLGTMDDAKEAKTTSELLQEVPVEEILEAKQEVADRAKLKTKLSKQMNQNDLFDL